MPVTLRVLLPALLLSGALVAAEEPISFARDIRPILSNHCLRCHGPDENERKGGPAGSGGLRLDTDEGAAMDLGGKKAVVPDHPELSELISRISTTDPDDVMPPPKGGKPLKPAEVDLLTRWIAGGGKFARHWSYEMPVRHELPVAGVHPVDAFIRARLTKEGLQPSPEADRATLARRVTLDLTGLPPSPEELEEFVSDPAPDAWERLVDRLLASPAYGEHWARQWLDLARYADSAGYADDPSRSIWGFRDYVIRAFNNNKPFDQFTVEQLAGDLLPDASEEQLIATAFHRNTMTNSEGGTNDEEFRNAAIIDRVNTTFSVWMGTSMACAQCHTHKYDPITQHEYFQIYAFLNNTEDADRRDEAPLVEFYDDAQKAQRQDLLAGIAAAEAKLAAVTPALQAAADQWGAGFPVNPEWQTLVPAAAKSQAGATLTIDPDGTVAAAAKAETDTVEVEIPLAAGQPLAALQLEALPDASLPGGGPGHSGGNFVISRVRATLTPPAGAPAPAVRYVRIELPGKGKLLQLAEVQVFSGSTNVAPQGVASQKSTFAGAAARRAIDGNTAAEYEKGSVSHTGADTDDPWWEVDLQAEHGLDRIVIWNRAELPERLDGFRIAALDASRNPVWEKSGNASALEIPFALTGAREIHFTDALADYVQPDFDEGTVIRERAGTPEKRRKKARGPQPGWAIGGAQGKAHVLTLRPDLPVEVPAGSVLRVTIAQASVHKHHTLGRFRLRMTSDPAVARLREIPDALAGALAKPAAERTEAERQEITAHYLREIAPELQAERDQRAALTARLEGIRPNTVPVYRELPPDKRRKSHVQLRGNYLAQGDEVTEGVPVSLHALPEGAPMNRLTLARWLVDDKNPLTARVVANRYWESLFGIGIVRTSEEFGSQGEMPTHPELLDWLATELVRTKWDLKKFVRLLVTSDTYRQSSKVSPEANERDPDNRLLARGPRVRLSAEMVRDQALAVSGLLSSRMYGPPVRPLRPALGLSAAFGGGLDWQTSEGENRYRRALYTEFRRTSPYPSLTTFDAPNREVCTVRRNRTNTPLQALVTLNDPVFVEAAQALARRVTAGSPAPDAVIRHAFQLVLSRTPSEREVTRLLALREDALAVYRQDAEKAMAMATNPIGPVPAGADTAELAAWTAVAGVLLNLDETLMKR